MGKLLPLSSRIRIFRNFPAAIRNVQSRHLSYSPILLRHRRYCSVADADMLLFQSQGLKAKNDINWYWFIHPYENLSLLIYVRTKPGQLIALEMSKVARLHDLMIPPITITFRQNSCTNVFLFYQYTTDMSSIVQIVLVLILFILKQYLFSSI